jgi:hypothetical protein
MFERIFGQPKPEPVKAVNETHQNQGLYISRRRISRFLFLELPTLALVSGTAACGQAMRTLDEIMAATPPPGSGGNSERFNPNGPTIQENQKPEVLNLDNLLLIKSKYKITVTEDGSGLAVQIEDDGGNDSQVTFPQIAFPTEIHTDAQNDQLAIDLGPTIKMEYKLDGQNPLTTVYVSNIEINPLLQKGAQTQQGALMGTPRTLPDDSENKKIKSIYLQAFRGDMSKPESRISPLELFPSLRQYLVKSAQPPTQTPQQNTSEQDNISQPQTDTSPQEDPEAPNSENIQFKIMSPLLELEGHDVVYLVNLCTADSEEGILVFYGIKGKQEKSQDPTVTNYKVISPVSGKVIGFIKATEGDIYAQRYGNAIMIEVENTNPPQSVIVGGMSMLSETVVKGQKIETGMDLGISGRTGFNGIEGEGFDRTIIALIKDDPSSPSGQKFLDPLPHMMDNYVPGSLDKNIVKCIVGK